MPLASIANVASAWLTRSLRCPPYPSSHQARKTFQKLIYVSNLVFGDRQAAFLLPWTRVFGLSDAQVGWGAEVFRRTLV
jgi:hypothetical protein